METKKILMVTSFYPPYHVGGACTHVYYLANELAKKGHEIHVLYSKDAYHLIRKNEPDKSKYKNHPNVCLHELKTPIGILSPLYSYVFGSIPFNKNVLNLFNQSYDLIHYHNISLLGPKVLQYGNSPKIYTAHDHWLICPWNDFFTKGSICTQKISAANCSLCLIGNKRPVQFWRHFNVLKKSLEDVRLIISPSNYLKNFLLKNSMNKPINVMPNFVPMPEIEETNSSERDDYFFYAGMLEEIKGISNLLGAFRDINKKLVIAGTGSMEIYVKNFIAKNRLKNILYAGWLDGKKIYPYYKNALAFILPSICPENCPNSILESFSVGTPAIGSNVGGIPDLIRKVDKNLIFNDVDSLKEKIINFDKKKYSTNRIKEVYKKYFSADIYMGNYIKIISKL